MTASLPLPHESSPDQPERAVSGARIATPHVVRMPPKPAALASEALPNEPDGKAEVRSAAPLPRPTAPRPTAPKRAPRRKAPAKSTPRVVGGSPSTRPEPATGASAAHAEGIDPGPPPPLPSTASSKTASIPPRPALPKPETTAAPDALVVPPVPALPVVVPEPPREAEKVDAEPVFLEPILVDEPDARAEPLAEFVATESLEEPPPVELAPDSDPILDQVEAGELPTEERATVLEDHDSDADETEIDIEAVEPDEDEPPMVETDLIEPDAIETDELEPEAIESRLVETDEGEISALDTATTELTPTDDADQLAAAIGIAAFDRDVRDEAEGEASVDLDVPALSVRNVSKSFGETRAVDGIDLTVPAGTFYGLVGPNGAGKTTTLSMIAGLLRPDGGSVSVNGVDAASDPVATKRMMGVLPDRLRTFDRLTGRQLLYYCGILRKLSPSVVESRTNDLARAFDLTDALGRVVSDYSAGMAKKVMLAGAMIHSPRLLVLDEPFESVDPVSSAIILDILGTYVAHGGTVILSSHGMDLVERVCSRVAVIVAGQVLAEGTIDEVRGELTLEQRFIELAGGLSDVEGLEWLHTFSD